MKFLDNLLESSLGKKKSVGYVAYTNMLNQVWWYLVVTACFLDPIASFFGPKLAQYTHWSLYIGNVWALRIVVLVLATWHLMTQKMVLGLIGTTSFKTNLNSIVFGPMAAAFGCLVALVVLLFKWPKYPMIINSGCLAFTLALIWQVLQMYIVVNFVHPDASRTNFVTSDGRQLQMTTDANADRVPDGPAQM